jgi:hypothetical protein
MVEHAELTEHLDLNLSDRALTQAAAAWKM